MRTQSVFSQTMQRQNQGWKRVFLTYNIVLVLFCCVALICLLHCLWWEWKIYLQGRDCFAHKRIGKELYSSQNGFVARVMGQILFGRLWRNIPPHGWFHVESRTWEGVEWVVERLSKRKLRSWGVKWYDQGHPVHKWQSCGLTQMPW